MNKRSIFLVSITLQASLLFCCEPAIEIPTLPRVHLDDHMATIAATISSSDCNVDQAMQQRALGKLAAPLVTKSKYYLHTQTSEKLYPVLFPDSALSRDVFCMFLYPYTPSDSIQESLRDEACEKIKSIKPIATLKTLTDSYGETITTQTTHCESGSKCLTQISCFNALKKEIRIFTTPKTRAEFRYIVNPKHFLASMKPPLPSYSDHALLILSGQPPEAIDGENINLVKIWALPKES